MRFAPLDKDVWNRIANDAMATSGAMVHLNGVLTHCDQLAPTQKAHLYFSGPTRDAHEYDKAA